MGYDVLAVSVSLRILVFLLWIASNIIISQNLTNSFHNVYLIKSKELGFVLWPSEHVLVEAWLRSHNIIQHKVHVVVVIVNCSEHVVLGIRVR